jgi:hypothetical protein
MWARLYYIIVKNETVYLFYLVPIVYFMTIVVRLVYYKLKYHQRIYSRDVIATATMILIFLDYVNYLYLRYVTTGRPLPPFALLIKYTIGFLLWAWMFWYSYKVHLKRNLTAVNLKKRWVVIAFIGTVFVILLVIGAVVS